MRKLVVIAAALSLWFLALGPGAFSTNAMAQDVPYPDANHDCGVGWKPYLNPYRFEFCEPASENRSYGDDNADGECDSGWLLTYLANDMGEVVWAGCVLTDPEQYTGEDLPDGPNMDQMGDGSGCAEGQILVTYGQGLACGHEDTNGDGIYMYADGSCSDTAYIADPDSMDCYLPTSVDADEQTVREYSILPGIETESQAEAQPETIDAGSVEAGDKGVYPILGTDVVSNADGDNVNCRSAASLDAVVIASLPEGTAVSILEQPANGWIRAASSVGTSSCFVSTAFLPLAQQMENEAEVTQVSALPSTGAGEYPKSNEASMIAIGGLMACLGGSIARGWRRFLKI